MTKSEKIEYEKLLIRFLQDNKRNPTQQEDDKLKFQAREKVVMSFFH